MLITIITVVRNDRHGLAQTIASVRSQTHRHFEFLIIDGASRDGTTAVIHENEDVIDYWVSRPDDGIYDAMNKGLLRASGDFVLFLNAGDVFHTRQSLAAAVKASNAHQDSDLLYFQAVHADGHRAGGSDQQRALLFDSVGNHQAVLCRTSVHQRFLFNARYRIKADRDVQLRMMLAGCRMTTRPIVMARVAGGGISSTAVTKKECENLLISYRNGVAIRWLLLATILAVTRVIMFGTARCCGFDWDFAKSVARAVFSKSGSRRQRLATANTAIQCEPPLGYVPMDHHS